MLEKLLAFHAWYKKRHSFLKTKTVKRKMFLAIRTMMGEIKMQLPGKTRMVGDSRSIMIYFMLLETLKNLEFPIMLMQHPMRTI